MLALSAKDYYLPVCMPDDEKWMIERINGDDMIVAREFSFTCPVIHEGSKDRFTFYYNGLSVRPAPRTLRRFGSTVTSSVVSRLSQLTMIRREWDSFHTSVLMDLCEY